MEKRIKVLYGKSAYDFEKLVNEFLEKSSGKLHDIKFSATPGEGFRYLYAILIYTPEEP